MTSTGKFRIYLNPIPNREGAAPLAWCIHNGSVEIAVSEVQIVGLARTVPHADGRPGVLEVDGKLLIMGSSATISAPTE